MRQQAVALDYGIGHGDLELMLHYITKLGGYGLGLFRVMDLGLPRETFEHHLNETIENLRSTASGEGPRLPLRPKGASNKALVETSNELWDFPQTLRFAAATTILAQYYKRWMDHGDLRRAITVKVLYKCQTGLLDDLVDKGDYNYLESKEIYHLVLSSMFNPTYSERAFMAKLVPDVREDQLDYLDLIVKFTTAFNSLMSTSPHGADLFYHMDIFNQRLVLTQALSMFQKAEHYNLSKVKRVAGQFYGPAGDIRWYDKLANAYSGGTQYNLLDMSFCHRQFNPSRLQNFLRAWWYLDAVITYLNGVITVYDDLRNNIVNPSLMAMREEEVLAMPSPKGYNPNLTQEDYDQHLAWVAELASRGLRILSKALPDPEVYFPFMVVMMPFMLMAEVIGKGDQTIRTYLEALAPAVKETMEEYEQRAKARVRFPLRGRATS